MYGTFKYLNTEQVRTRLICGADLVGVNVYRALTAPVYQSQKRCPLSDLSAGAAFSDVFTAIELHGAYKTCMLQQARGQPAMGAHISRALMRMSLCRDTTFFQTEDLTSEHVLHRVSEIKSILSPEMAARLDFAKRGDWGKLSARKDKARKWCVFFAVEIRSCSERKQPSNHTRSTFSLPPIREDSHHSWCLRTYPSPPDVIWDAPEPNGYDEGLWKPVGLPK